jgi:RNA polymerase sigma-70 factor (ECF subfamily)
MTSAARDVATDETAIRPPGDEELVERMAAGDRAAFAALYDRYGATLLALAQRLLRSPSDAEDLLHDVCMETWRQAHTYRPSRGSVRAWLVVRLRSRALDRLRSARHAPLVPQDMNGGAGELAGRQVDPLLRSECERAQQALAGLPQDQRTVLELAYLEGLALPEIGERLAIPVGTAKSRLSRGLAKLRDRLQAKARCGNPSPGHSVQGM